MCHDAITKLGLSSIFHFKIDQYTEIFSLTLLKNNVITTDILKSNEIILKYTVRLSLLEIKAVFKGEV